MKQLFLTLLLSISLFANAQKDSTKVENFQKTDEVLSEVVKKALTVAEKTGDFVIEQAPLLLQEFYRWHICANIFGILLGLFLCFLAYKIPLLWLSNDKDYYDTKFFSKYGDESGMIAWIFFIIVVIIGAIFLFCSIYELVYILVAPKLYLIDYYIK
ncbi:MAG: hypothetical protein H7174_07265 [Flavobacterium sp.]|nr:hypothetical protein [Flavobacterium sp.]